MERLIRPGTPLITLLCCLFAAAPLKAGDWAIGGFLGATSTRPNTLTLEQQEAGTHVSMDPVRYDSKSLQPPIYYGYRVTWFMRRHFGLEAEFMHPKVFARTREMVHATGTVAAESVNASVPMDSLVERFSISHGLNLLLVNAVFTHQLDHGTRPRWLLTARGGAGLTIPHAESEIRGRTQEQYERGAPGVQVAFGGELRVAGHVYATAEYKLTTTAQSVSVVGGTMEGRFTTHHLAVGVAWHR